MTLYEFNVLPLDKKLEAVWDLGTFLDNYINDSERANCYAIDKFFVEIYYDKIQNSITHVETFKCGSHLDRYSNLKI